MAGKPEILGQVGRQLAAADIHVLDHQLHEFDAVDAGAVDRARRFRRIVQHGFQRFMANGPHGNEDVAQAPAGARLVLNGALHVLLRYKAARDQNVT